MENELDQITEAHDAMTRACKASETLDQELPIEMLKLLKVAMRAVRLTMKDVSIAAGRHETAFSNLQVGNGRGISFDDCLDIYEVLTSHEGDCHKNLGELWANRIIRRRKEVGITASELARRCGVHENHIYDIQDQKSKKYDLMIKADAVLDDIQPASKG